jgi:dsRNA-specific ribonuclease
LVNQRILAATLDGKTLPYTGRDLKRIAGQINTAEEEMKETKQAYFRGTYDEQLREMIEMSAQNEETAASALSNLDAGQFHSVLRMAAESGILQPDVEEELLARLDAELLGAHDLFTILFRFQQNGAAWERVKRASLEWLQSHIYHAPSLLVMGQQSLGWDEPEWEVMPVGTNFQARARINIAEQRYRSSWHISSRKADSRQAAAAELLARIAGIEIAPAASDMALRSQEASAVATATPSNETGGGAQKLPNYKGQLQEFARAQGWDMPTYREQERSGPSHALTFTVEASVTIDGHTYTAEGSGTPRVQAEHAAAWHLLQELPRSGSKSAVLLARAETQAVSLLQELAQQQQIRGVTFSYEQSGPSHAPIFTCTCVVTALDGQTIQEQAQGAAKKAAAQAAAFQAVSGLLARPSPLSF